MRKHYILLAVTVPSFSEHEKLSQWNTLRATLVNRAESNKEIKTLAENVWLIGRDRGLLFVSECVSLAESYGLKHNHWFLDEE
jgi:hypothetical protein